MTERNIARFMGDHFVNALKISGKNKMYANLRISQVSKLTMYTRPFICANVTLSIWQGNSKALVTH